MPKIHDHHINVFDNPLLLAEQAANSFVTLARQAITNHGRFSVALSGGTTPERMYHLLAKSPLREQVDWKKVHLFWGDERFVPPDNPASTLRIAREILLSQVPIPAANIYPIRTVGLAPAGAAMQYAQMLGDFFDSSPPRFDLIFLGMGSDGHVASLFPGQPEVTLPSDRLVVEVTNAPKPPPIRITMTFKTINQAANIIFLVAGSNKAQAISAAFSREVDPARYPVQGIRPLNGRVLWLLDKDAGQELNLNILANSSASLAAEREFYRS